MYRSKRFELFFYDREKPNLKGYGESDNEEDLLDKVIGFEDTRDKRKANHDPHFMLFDNVKQEIIYFYE